MSTRIDRCYINKGALAFTHSCKHVSLPSSISDHEAGVSFTIRAINASTKGSGYWKLNASLLKRPGYKKLIESTINDFSSARDAYPDVKSWWESLKYAIQIVTQPYAKEQNGQRKRTIDSLERQLLSVNEDICSPTLSCPELALKKERLSVMLADYYNDIHEAAKVKAGAKHALHGEKPTAYFSSLVKARAQKSLITEIDPGNNSAILTNIDDILHEATNFYSTLYQAKNTNKGVKRSLFLEALDVTLCDSDKAFCDRKVDKDEVLSSLRKLSSGKAPGVDGLPVEFYKTFWPSIGDAYMDLLLECLESKELPLTMRTSVITLIYKKEDRDKLKNYRPISLLCADHKIIARVMAEE